MVKNEDFDYDGGRGGVLVRCYLEFFFFFKKKLSCRDLITFLNGRSPTFTQSVLVEGRRGGARV